MNSIVIFYSRAGYNYVSGEIKDLKVGNVEVIAKKIAELTNSDIFKIEQVHPYSKDYSECIDEAKRDQRLEIRPEVKGFPNNLKVYDVIYLGYPNYWGTMPMPMFTFLENVNLDNKIIKPFCSHEGSEFGRSIEDIKRIFPKVKIEKGIAIHGSVIHEEELKKWLNIGKGEKK